MFVCAWQTVAVLGEGAFGLVKLVRLKTSPTTTWAFKCMQKQRIVATKQQANVMREKTLLAQARHPFLLRLEATMQDQHCLHVKHTSTPPRIFLDLCDR